MLECSMTNVKWLMRWLDSIRDLYTTININCTEYGWRCTCLTESKTLLCDLQLEHSFFEYYHCPKPCSLVFRSQQLLRQLKLGATVTHPTLPTKCHIRWHPTNANAKIHFRLDFDTSGNVCEFELPQAEDIPQDSIVPDTGCLPRMQFGTDELKKIVLNMSNTGFEDTMKIKIKTGSIQFLANGENSKAAITVPHDDTSSSEKNWVLCDHLEPGVTHELLCSLQLLTHIAKCNLSHFWEVQVEDSGALVFRLPIFQEDAEFMSDRGKEGTAYMFFHHGYKKNSSANNSYNHMDDPPHFQGEKMLERETVDYDITHPVNTQRDYDPDSEKEQHPTFGKRQGLMTFYLPPKKNAGGGEATIMQFMTSDISPLAKKRRDNLFLAAQNGDLTFTQQDEDGGANNAANSKKANINKAGNNKKKGNNKKADLQGESGIGEVSNEGAAEDVSNVGAGKRENKKAANQGTKRQKKAAVS